MDFHTELRVHRDCSKDQRRRRKRPDEEKIKTRRGK